MVTPTGSSIAKGTTVQLTATGVFSDGTTQDFTLSASWTSTPAGFATVDPDGLVTGTSVGSATITATQAGVSGATTVTVTPAVLTSIVVTPTGPSIAKGTSGATYRDRNPFRWDYSGSHPFGELDFIACGLCNG